MAGSVRCAAEGYPGNPRLHERRGDLDGRGDPVYAKGNSISPPAGSGASAMVLTMSVRTMTERR